MIGKRQASLVGGGEHQMLCSYELTRESRRIGHMRVEKMGEKGKEIRKEEWGEKKGKRSRLVQDRNEMGKKEWGKKGKKWEKKK